MDRLYNRDVLARTTRSVSLRAGVFLAATLLLLLAVYGPARTVFRTTGDVDLYQHYAELALAQPMQLPREYPPAAAGLFVLPELLTPDHYLLGFALLAAVAAWLTVFAVDYLGGHSWWLLLYLGLSAWGTLFFRFDIFVALITVFAFAATARRRWLLAQALLVVGVALKLYPLLLMPIVVCTEWRDRRRVPLVSGLGGMVLLTLVVTGMWLAAPDAVVGMVGYHQQRPLEFESIGASVAWLLGPATMEFSYGSFNLLSPYAPALIGGLTVANLVLLGVLYLLVVAGRLAPGPAWTLTLLIGIVTSKVFSTQYLVWVVPLLVLMDVGGEEPAQTPRHRWLWALVCVLTSLIYPVGYTLFESLLLIGRPPPWLMAAVTLRNSLMLVAMGGLVRAALLPAPRAHSRAGAADSVTNDVAAR